MRLFPVLLVTALLAFFASSAWSRAEIDCSAPVDTEYGKVRGERMSDSCVFRGIPFAAPPVGDLRWRSPEPHPGWSGVRDATEFSPQCMQKGVMALEGELENYGMSEDCLYLNIWRPRKEGSFPVLFWIHGGGYQGGTGRTPWYWGDRLAQEHDVVVVTINYRLNVFGFFAHPDLRKEDPHNATGGQGSLDQVMALEWVRENIGNFGGDPANITIFGESAGGWSVCTMLATPLNKGDFHRAILESGGCEQSQSLEKGYKQARQVAAEMGCDYHDVGCLRNVPAKKLMEEAGGSLASGFDAKPHHDGHLLTGTPLSMIREGNYNQVPFMAGYNRDEFANAMKLTPRYYYTLPGQYEDRLGRMGFSDSEVKELVSLYPLREFDNRPVEAYGRMLGADASLACPTYFGLLEASRRQNNTYFYRFEYDDFTFGKYMGAAHAMEIPFIFGNLDRMPANYLYTRFNIDKARKLSEIIQSYVINFARTGDPNGSGLSPWPEFRPDNRRLMVFDEQTRVETMGVQRQRCNFWKEHQGEVGWRD
ncbi:MAG: carboxylesterase family protein [bacterium]